MHSNSASPTISKLPASTISPAKFTLWRLQHGLVAAAILLFLGVLVFVIWRPIQVLPRIGTGPDFVLQDQNGQSLTNGDLRGQFVLYNFTYTSCEEPCPQTGAAMRQIQQRLQEVETGGIPIQLVTISFDPARDTPARLTAYAEKIGADLRNWRFVTGAPDLLKQVIGGGFGIYYAPEAAANGAPQNVQYKFEPTFVLMDGLGILRAKYQTATPDVEVVVRDVELLATEVRNSQGAARYAYETAHLFLCYPK